MLNLLLALAGLYGRTLRLILNAPVVTGAIALAFGAFARALFGVLDEELVPPEDRGVLHVFATGPDGVSLGQSERQADRIEEIIEPCVGGGCRLERELREAASVPARASARRAE